MSRNNKRKNGRYTVTGNDKVGSVPQNVSVDAGAPAMPHSNSTQLKAESEPICPPLISGSIDCRLAQLRDFRRVYRVLPFFGIIFLALPMLLSLLEMARPIHNFYAILTNPLSWAPSWLQIVRPVPLTAWVESLARIGLVANVLRLFLSLWLTEDTFVRLGIRDGKLVNNTRSNPTRFESLCKGFAVFLDWTTRFLACLFVYLAVINARSEGLVAFFIFLCYAVCALWDTGFWLVTKKHAHLADDGVRALRKITSHWLAMDWVGFIMALIYLIVAVNSAITAEPMDKGGVLGLAAIFYISFLIIDVASCRYDPVTGKTGLKSKGVFLYRELIFGRKPIVISAREGSDVLSK